MDIVNSIVDYFKLEPDHWEGWVPAENIDRQDWQLFVEALSMTIRTKSERPAFGFSEAEISVHFHRPIDRFVHLIGEKLGISLPNPFDSNG